MGARLKEGQGVLITGIHRPGALSEETEIAVVLKPLTADEKRHWVLERRPVGYPGLPVGGPNWLVIPHQVRLQAEGK